MILKNIDLQVYRGEFLCVIGDVGSGKSSLLSALIGDMIYVPDEEIEAFGGLEKEAKPKAFSKLKKRVLGPNFTVDEKPITINGRVSYVEQVSWIQNKTIKENILFD